MTSIAAHAHLAVSSPLLALLLALSRPHLHDDDVLGVIVKQLECRLGELGHAWKTQPALAGLWIVYSDGRNFSTVLVGIKAYRPPLSIFGVEFRFINRIVGILPSLKLGFDR